MSLINQPKTKAERQTSLTIIKSQLFIRSLRPLFRPRIMEELKKSFLDRFLSQLKDRGLNIEEMRGVVVDGVEIDAILKDNEVVVIEVATTIGKSNVLDLPHKLDIASRVFARKARAVMLGVKVDSEAPRLARKKDVNVFKHSWRIIGLTSYYRGQGLRL